MNTETEEDAIGYANTGDAVIVAFRGKALKNLAAIADAMNAVPWCDSDNTPESVLALLISDVVDTLEGEPLFYGKIPAGGMAEAADMIVSGIDTGAEPDTPEDEARRAELRKEFARHGWLHVA